MIRWIQTCHGYSNKAPLIAALTVAILLTACGEEDGSSPLSVSDESLAEQEVITQADFDSLTQGQDPGDPIVLYGQDGITIRGLTITADPAVELHGCRNVTIIDCDLSRIVVGGSNGIRIVNNIIHESHDEGIYLDDCQDVLIQGNRIERVKAGVLAHKSTRIQVVGNYCQDMLGPLPGGQFVQFDKVTGPNNAITDNYAMNHFGKSNPEDMINLYHSHGTEQSPILIEKNYLSGDPEHGSQGKSNSGSGIMLGDNGGSWQLCRNNTLVSPGQVGIGVAGGEHITVESNIILSKASDVSNVGLYVWNQYEDKPAGMIVLRKNKVAWVNHMGQDNPFWDGGGFTHLNKKDNVFGGKELFKQIEVPMPPTTAPQPPLPFGASDE